MSTEHGRELKMTKQIVRREKWLRSMNKNPILWRKRFERTANSQELKEVNL